LFIVEQLAIIKAADIIMIKLNFFIIP